MQRSATEANRTIAVLSQKYLNSSFTQPEWAAAFVQDPQGKTRKLIPVRIEFCEPTGILAPIVYLDLVGLPEEDARAAFRSYWNNMIIDQVFVVAWRLGIELIFGQLLPTAARDGNLIPMETKID
jgi:TIR domain